jgi:hypothetical protein
MARSFSKLTRPNMRALKVGARLTEQGITFERMSNGDGAFTVNVMVDGRRIHRSLGRESEGVTRTTAEEFVAKVKSDAREGRLNLPKRRKIPLSFGAAGPLYIERLCQEDGREIRRKRQQLEQNLLPFFRDIQISRITSFDVERYQKHRLLQPIRSRKRDTWIHYPKALLGYSRQWRQMKATLLMSVRPSYVWWSELAWTRNKLSVTRSATPRSRISSSGGRFADRKAHQRAQDDGHGRALFPPIWRSHYRCNGQAR